MNSENTGENESVNLVQCKLHAYGCTDLYPENQISKHYASEAHINSFIIFIYSLKSEYDDALINCLINPIEPGALSSSANTTRNNHLQIFERLTDFLAGIIPQPNTTAIAPNGPSSLNRTYNSNYSASRNLLLQMDRDPNHGMNLQAYQEEYQLNQTTMSSISSRLTESSSDGDHENSRPEQDQDLPSDDEQSTIQHHSISTALLQIESESRPVSTDGFLPWRIDKVSDKIKDATNGSKPYVNSRPFQISIDGRRVWARVYFNGKTDHKFISVHVHRNLPDDGIFDAAVKFVLIDQNTSHSPQHYAGSCNGKMDVVGSCLGFDTFIDQKMLREEGNRYVRDDSIYFLIYVKQIDQEKFAELPKYVQDALKTFF